MSEGGSGPPVLGAVELAGKLGLVAPTPEQVEVIEAPLEPMVVMAGAGSGKSETMAGRVVWLVANGLVSPERVLGLTFTRKAAAELATRVRKRLAALVDAKLVSPELLREEPTISTYHSYAARLVADHALREALEPTMRLVPPAVAWQLANRVVSLYDGPMDRVEWSPTTVTRAVLELAGELAEHLRTPADVRRFGTWLADRLAEVGGRITAAQREPLNVQATREQLLPLVEAYGELKREREVVDYADQMALAARIAANHREVGEMERDRFSVVLLDEYQDTSHAQLVLLRALFGGGHPVTAVGDPCQSIYGWRGASAGNLTRFAHDFPLASGDPAPIRQLSVSFRNGDRVLDVAARVQLPLRMEAREVPVLVPGRSRVDRGRVVCAFHETAVDEAEWVAEQVVALLGVESAPDGLPWVAGERDTIKPGLWGGPRAIQPSDIAILTRRRSQFRLLRRALEDRGVPVEVVGLGGLLVVPEVADIVATLRVLYDATAGDALVRLLTGPRWRIGPADLKVLGDLARELNDETRESAPAEGDILDQVVADLSQEQGSLIDALDELPERPDWQDRFSPLARIRLVLLAKELRTLRAHAGQPLPDLISEIERRTGLDVEVAAQPGRASAFAARADIDAFIDAAARFAGDAEDPTLGPFLAYLKAAAEEEHGLDGGRVSDANTVKLMTIHAAKGLEWPVVIIPGMSQLRSASGALATGTIFPAKPLTSSRWTENPRKLPYPLRGDAADLPRLTGLSKEELQWFDEECRERDLLEERRLAYVAVTRAHYLLIASGYRWGTGSRPLEPSDFLLEIRDTCGWVDRWVDTPPAETNPLLAEPDEATWPVTPEGTRYEAVLDGSRMVEEALAERSGTRDAPPESEKEATPAKTAALAERGVVASVGLSEPEDAVPSDGEAARAGERKAAGQISEPDGAASFDGEDTRAVERKAAGQVSEPGGTASFDGEDTRAVERKAAGQVSEPGGTAPPAREAARVSERKAGSAPRRQGGMRERDRERMQAWERDTELLLREREQARRRPPTVVELPHRLTVSSLVTLAADPGELARRIRRPLPAKPAPPARRGTAFHAWLATRWGQQRLLDDLDLTGGDGGWGEDDAELAELRARFEESEWATREPIEMEVPFETMIADRVIRGRMDAVFRTPDGRYDVVDWKTGHPPTGAAARAAAVQLATYRLAWADLSGTPLDRVGAAFHYVRVNQTVRPVDLLDASGLAALIESIPTA